MGERLLRPAAPTRRRELARGALLTVGLVGGFGAAAALAIRAADRLHPALGRAVEIYLAWTTLATRDLLDETGAVLCALEDGDLVEARRLVARVVGRDTDALDADGVRRAVVETVAESASDGIVAPIFWLCAGGVPLAIAYKAASTLDSMVGHIEPPYTHFGRASARLDDVANLVPARLTAALVVLAAAPLRQHRAGALRVWARDAARHPSPNAGHPEAAMAGALDVRLGGTNRYDGVAHERPFLNAEGGACTPRAARASLALTLAVSAAAAGGAAVVCRWLRARRSR